MLTLLWWTNKRGERLVLRCPSTGAPRLFVLQSITCRIILMCMTSVSLTDMYCIGGSMVATETSLSLFWSAFQATLLLSLDVVRS